MLAACRSCNRRVGVFNSDLTSVSLFKWQVTINSLDGGNHDQQPTLATCVSAMLIASMARTGCSKSVILPMKTHSASRADSSALLHIWVFNANIKFSSTEEDRSPVDAIKVFFRLVSETDANKMLDSMVSDVQDIILPPDAVEGLGIILQQSNEMLLRSDRQFKDWSVGLIERWNNRSG